MEFTPASLGQRIVDLGLAEPAQIDQMWAEVGRTDVTMDEYTSALLRKSIVTNFQLERMLTGERLGYFYGPYKVLYMIGAGTFARVYRCAHKDTGRVVAVKVLRRRHRDQPREVEQFLREGRMGLQLRHPNIVSIYAIENDPRTPYLVMEFVEGETLREILKIRKKFDPLSALKIIADVCSGLDFAANRGISHRDLKLSNVLVSFSGRCKLVDFGLAAMADTDTPEALADCPNARAIDYAALERGTGVRKDDSRSDIYFVGCILYHILTGRSPLTETRDRLTRLNITRFREVAPLATLDPTIPVPVINVCARAMDLDPTARYQSAGLMLNEVDGLIRRIEAGDDLSEQSPIRTSSVAIDPEAAKEGRGKTVMLVESKLDLQDLVREKLKSRGYRVLVYGDPYRAIARFNAEETPPANCVVFSAPELGNAALEAFNKFGSDRHTKHLPAILLVDRKQQHIISNAECNAQRMMLAMPLKVRELRTALVRLLSNQTEAAPIVADEE